MTTAPAARGPGVGAAWGTDAKDEIGGGGRRGSPEEGLLGVELLGERLEVLDDGVKFIDGDTLPGGMLLVEGALPGGAGAQ